MNTPFNEQRFLSLIKFTHVITKIFKILLIIAFSATIILFFVGIIVPKDLLIFNLSELDIQFGIQFSDTLRLAADQFEGTVSLKTILIYAGLFGAISLVFVVYLVNLLEKVLLDVKEATPFSDANVKSITYAAFTFFIASIIIPLLNVIFLYQLTRDIVRPNFDVSYSVNIGYVFIGLLLYLLAKIFAYGGFLQHSYDETV